VKNLSGGNIALSLACQWWLTDESVLVKDPATPAMAQGNAVHKAIELDILGSTDFEANLSAGMKAHGVLSSAGIDRKYAAWRVWAKTNRRVGWSPEKAIAYNVRTDTARLLPDTKGWSRFSGVDRTCEIPLVIDVVAMGSDVHGPYAEVIDWKTGRENQDKDGMQIRACALGAARLFGVPRARARVIYILEDEVIERDEMLEEFDFDGLAFQLGWVFRLEDSDPKPGVHCNNLYCAAKESCLKKMIETKENDK
jgi:hypothetical protein